MQIWQRDVAVLDAKSKKELADAKKTFNNLHQDVDYGAKQPRVAATYPGVSKTTASASMDNAGAPELNPDARWNYLDHRDGNATADQMIRGIKDQIKEQHLRNKY